MTRRDGLDEDWSATIRAMAPTAKQLGLGAPIGDQPAKATSVDGPDWWAARADQLWKRWIGGLALSPARFDVAIRVGIIDGEPVVTGLHIETDDGTPLRDRDLRTISLRRLLEDLPELAHQPKRPFLGRDVEALRPRRPGRAGYPDDHYAKVAEVYRDLRDRFPNAPTARTAEALHAHPATIRRWVARARALGYLEDDE